MIHGDRVQERMAALGISQSALARELGISQQAIGKIAKGETRNTAHLSRLARALRTSPEYLEAITDDPDENVSASVEPVVQYVNMRVALPSEAALTRMFEGLLLPLDQDLSRAELARTLAQRLPIGLAQVQDLLPQPAQAEARGADEAPPTPATGDRASPRQPRT